MSIHTKYTSVNISIDTHIHYITHTHIHTHIHYIYTIYTLADSDWLSVVI